MNLGPISRSSFNTPTIADQPCLCLLQKKKQWKIFLSKQWSLLMPYNISVLTGRQYLPVAGWFQAANIGTHLPCSVPTAIHNAQQCIVGRKRKKKTKISFWKESSLVSSSIPFSMLEQEVVELLHKLPTFMSTVKRWKTEYRFTESEALSIINLIITNLKPNMTLCL